MSKSNANRNLRRTLVIGASVLALGTSNGALAQTFCGNGSPGPVCPIDNDGSIGTIVGTPGTATIITNSGTITGTPAIDQGASSVLNVVNQAGGLIDGNGGTAIQASQQFGFVIDNAGSIEGDVIFTDGPAQPSMFSASVVRYISDGGTLNGDLQLGSANGYTTAVFVQRGVDDGVTGMISAGAGIDVYAKSYGTSQSIELGEYALPASFEVEGYELLGTDTTVTLTGSGATIALMGNGNVVNEGTIDSLDTTGLFPVGVTVNPAAIFYVAPQMQLYRREQVPIGQPNSFYAQPFGSALHSFTNNGTINGDVALATASFTNNGEITIASNSGGTAIFTSANEDFLFRNAGSIVMTDAGPRPANVLIPGEFFDEIESAVRLQSAISTSEAAKVTIQNVDSALISGGLAFSGVASEFVFVNDGMIEIGDNPLDLDRAVTILLGGFDAAIDPAMRQDVVSDSVTIDNGGVIEGGIEVESETRAFTFTNTGTISRDPSDPFAAAIELAAYDWRDTPDGPDVHNPDTFAFNNSGTISGTVEADAEASWVSILNSGSIEAEARPGYTTVSDAEDSFFLSQETILGAELIFENTGTISNADYAGGAVTLEIEAGNISSGVAGAEQADATVTVVNSGSIIASGGNYITTLPYPGLQPGELLIDFSTALMVDVDAEGTGSLSIMNEEGGLIDARGAPYLGAPGGPQALPDPSPDSGGLAIVARAHVLEIMNDGTIRGTSGGPLIGPDGTFIPRGADGFNFEGVIGGAIDTFDSSDDVVNSATGVIQGGIALRQGDDTLINYGSITGSIWAGSGADTFTQAGTVTGNIDMGDGKDWLQVTGYVDGNITMGGGDVDIFITPLAGVATRFGGTIDGGAGVGDNFIFAVQNGGSIEDMAAVTMTGFEFVALAGTGTVTSDGTAHGPIQLSVGEITFAQGSTFNASATYAFRGDSPLAQSFRNDGTINGSISLGAADDTFANYGTLNGNLELGDGNDTFIQSVAAIFTGVADGGTGSDTFVLDLGSGGSSSTNIYSQLINFEVLTTIGTGSVAVEGTDDGEEFNNDGTFEGNIGLGGGNDTFNQTGTFNGNVDLGEGDDKINNTGTVNGKVDLGTGNNQFVNSPAAIINGNVQAGTGNDKLENQGTINGHVDLGVGNNQFVNAPAATITGDVASGTGNDQIGNQGIITGNIYLDGNQQTPQQVGLFAMRTPAAVNPTGGDDEMTNDGAVNGSIFAAGGNDVLKNTGTVTGDIDMGDGDDVLSLSGNWMIGGTASGGDGLDRLNLTFADATSGEEPQLLDLAGFAEFEALEIAGGTGKIEGAADFGAIDIVGGRLIGAAESVITGNVSVRNGGTFGSAGTVKGDIVVASGGTLSPGASPAVMNVVGDVSLAAGSVTTFEFVPAPGQSDQLLIDGDLAITPGAVLNLVGSRPLTPGVAYDLIVANEITGTFTIGTWDNSAIQGFLAYRDAAGADRLQLLGTFVATGDVGPQAEAAIDYVNNVLIAGDASAALLDSVPDLLDGNGYASAAAFALIGPEAYASANQLGTERGLGLARTLRNGVAAPRGADARPYVFGTGFGDWRTLKSHASSGTSRARSDTYGILGGIGFGSENASVAGFVGYLDSDQSIAAIDARTKVDGVSAGLIGQVTTGSLHLSALAAYDWGKADTGRAAPGAAVVTSEYRLRSLVLEASAGYDVPISAGWALRPEVGVTHISTKRGAVEEAGSAAFALDVDAVRHKATFVDGGIRIVGGEADGAAFHPWMQLGVRQQLEGETGWASAGFTGSTSRFLSPGAVRRDTVVTAGAGFGLDLSPSARLSAAYQGEFGGGTGSLVSLSIAIGF